MTTPELTFYLRSLARFIYFVTDEEDRFLVRLQQTLKEYTKRTWVYNAAFGLVPIDNLVADWKQRTHTQNNDTLNIHDALIQIYKDDPKREQNFYVVTDPERWLADAHIQRRFLNIAHQLHQDNTVVKIVIFVGSRKVVPEKLSKYVEVVHDKGLTSDEILDIVQDAARNLHTEAPAESPKLFKGLSSYEIKMAISQSIIATKKDPKNPRRIDPGIVSEYRQKQLRKSDLVQYIDTSTFNFDDVGGAGRFKAWAKKTRATWTDAGQKFGLKPPKGVLLVGVWGCGKSLSVKALGHAWNLPVVQVEMGKLRSSGVGESEANVYRVTRLIEAAAPCIVWIDEAEKSLSGGASSAQSDAGTTSRTIGILSTWLQETDAKVCLAMTANSLKTLPVEFVNRMDERFFFDMPTEEDRVDILKIHLRKAGQSPDHYDLADLSEKAQGMVGREMEQAIGAAMVESFDRGKKALDEDVLSTELAGKPRIIKTMTDEVKEILEWVGYDAEANDGIRAKFASAPDRKTGALKLIGSDD